MTKLKKIDLTSSDQAHTQTKPKPKPHFNFSELTVADIPLVFAIEQQSHLSPWSTKIFESSFNHLSHNFAIELDGDIVGYYFTQFVAGEMNLDNICVAQKHQGKGLAIKLMTHLIEHAKSLHAEEIWLEVRESNLPAIKLYHGFDFEFMGKRDNYYAVPLSNMKETALLMRKTLKA